MRSGGWRPFWTSLLASLLVLVPLVGGTVLLSRQQLRAQLRQAARLDIAPCPGAEQEHELSLIHI